jgi:enoyl-CoA hydratase/carnithine racemase
MLGGQLNTDAPSPQGKSTSRPIVVEQDDRVLWATVDNPPINLIDEAFIQAFEGLIVRLEDSPDIGVLVLTSADPDFFLAHVDIERVGGEPTSAPPRGEDIGRWHTMCERLRSLPQATIAMVEGRARGGGSEILLATDMVFAATETAIFAQPEVGFGIIPGGGGSARLPYEVGRARALEIILGCEDFSAELAERYGWINRALPADELKPFVTSLAHRIASFPRKAIEMSKLSVDASRDEPLREALLTELWAFNQTLATEEVSRRFSHYMSKHAQRRDSELELGRILTEINGGPSDDVD